MLKVMLANRMLNVRFQRFDNSLAVLNADLFSSAILGFQVSCELPCLICKAGNEITVSSVRGMAF